MSKAKTEGSYWSTTLTVNEGVFRYWEVIQELCYPHLGLDELVEDSVAFYNYLFAREEWDGPRPKWAFRTDAWDRLTGLHRLNEEMGDVAEDLSDAIPALRCAQLAVEQYLPKDRWVDPSVPFGVYKESPVAKQWQRIPAREFDIKEAVLKFSDAKRLRAIYPYLPVAHVSNAKHVSLSMGLTIGEGFRELANHYGLNPTQGLLIVLEQMPRFYAMHQGRSPSFREDLVTRWMRCMEVVDRMAYLLTELRGNQDRVRALSSVLAERIPLYLSGARGGQTLSEFLKDLDVESAVAKRKLQKRTSSTQSPLAKEALMQLGLG